MANPKHLKILRQGVETWNQWRRDHPNVVPDLHGANLREANLVGAGFEGGAQKRGNADNEDEGAEEDGDDDEDDDDGARKQMRRLGALFSAFCA